MRLTRWNRAVSVAGVALLLVGATAPQVQAHDAASGPNGGQVIEVKGHHLELTTKDNEITLYLSDEAHSPIASKGASGRAVVLEGSKQASLALTPAEPNRLLARLEAPLSPGARVVVTARLVDGHDVIARFVVK